MADIHLVRTVKQLRAALAKVPDDAAFAQVLPGDPGVVVMQVVGGNGQLQIISVRDERFAEIEETDIVHAHGVEDFHGHTFAEYREHEALTDERLPPF